MLIFIVKIYKDQADFQTLCKLQRTCSFFKMDRLRTCDVLNQTNYCVTLSFDAGDSEGEVLAALSDSVC